MYKAGVIGCRGIGIAHATGIVRSDRASLAAACDLDEETLREFEQRWPDENLTLYRDHREMLARESLDIVTVATSDHRHADLVVDAANAGAKGIFCEKPLATSLADADRMIAACDANNTTLSVDHTRRFIPCGAMPKKRSSIKASSARCNTSSARSPARAPCSSATAPTRSTLSATTRASSPSG